jgi:Holliday junction resolvase RusA-like endonuclease
MSKKLKQSLEKNNYVKYLISDKELKDEKFLKKLEKEYDTLIKNQGEKKVFKFVFFLDTAIGASRPHTKTVYNAKAGKHVSVVYDPESNKRFKWDFLDFVKTQIPKDWEAKEGEFSVKIKIFKKTPESFSQARKILCELGKFKPLKTPDNDNHIKILLDALNGHLFLDDKQNTITKITKYYSIRPRIEMIIKIYTNKAFKLQ